MPVVNYARSQRKATRHMAEERVCGHRQTLAPCVGLPPDRHPESTTLRTPNRLTLFSFYSWRLSCSISAASL